MDTHQTPEQIIASAMALPPDQRAAIITALQESIPSEAIDHGPEDPANEVETAWNNEIAKRIDDIDSGRIETVESDEAWKIINGDTSPQV